MTAVDLREAIRFYENRQLPEAERLCRKALSQNPADARASHLLGRIAIAGGRFDDAVRSIGRGVALLPGEVV